MWPEFRKAREKNQLLNSHTEFIKDNGIAFFISSTTPPVSTSPKNHPTCTTYLATYFQFFSYLFIVPFRTRTNHDNIVVCEPVSKPAKILCLVVQAMAELFIVYSIYDAARYMISPGVDAWAVLTFISHLFEILLETIIFYKFWWDRPQLEGILNLLQNYRHSNKKNRKLIYSPEVVIPLTYFFLLLAGYLSNYRRGLIWSASYAITDLFTVQEYTLFLPVENREREILSCVIFCFLFFLQRVTSVCELLLFSASLSMYQLVKSGFREEVRDQKSAYELMECFMKMRNCFSDFNETFTKTYLTHYVSTLLYYIRTSAILTKMPFGADKSYNLVYIVVHGLTYCFACEVYKMVKSSMKSWIRCSKMSRDVSHVDLTRISILGTEVETDPVGISCHFYPISYGLMGSFLGLLATYAIFAVQMQANGT